MKKKKIRLRAPKSLPKVVKQTKARVSLTQLKNLSEFDLESHKVIECWTRETWLRKKIVLMYYLKDTFTVEVSTKHWFKRETQVYSDLTWIQAINLFREETK